MPPQREGRGGSPDAGLSDAQLIEGMRDGDNLAYEELFRRHSARSAGTPAVAAGTGTPPTT
ncbi:hypothetical protein SMICM304S_09468 [Streptomyces microflavus]